MSENIPWTEKYRPTSLHNVVMNDYNKFFFNNIISNNIFPNILLYGPPGTGKTTTIINLINEYQNKYNKINKAFILHLNASDERGIDIIRNNINTFVKNNNMFGKMKFVILDEVDYMTKVAQIALSYLISENNNNIRYCLICNYISKIENSLKNNFCKIKFNFLPSNYVYNYINNINIIEKLKLSSDSIYTLINYYDNDIRSMINYIQSNRSKAIINNNVYEKLFALNLSPNYDNFYTNIIHLQNQFNTSINFIIKNYIFYILSTKFDHMTSQKISDYELIIHNINNSNYCIKYLYFILHS
ncbi:MAG: hypothetical protein CMP83_08040 [Gammaproteobacteria bacterium]|nr:hypothetical protein [Gammaproteobacteria bacterium]